MDKKMNYLNGEKIGECIYIKEVHPYIAPNGAKQRKAEFKCKCGNYFEAVINALKNGNTISCGCASKDNGKTHGLTKHKLYSVFKNMKNRCYNIKNKDYKFYGERGVIICDEWLKSFQNFSNWCFKNGWRNGLVIDRIDTHGDYNPNNCRFITQKENLRNTRKNVNITFNNMTKCLIEWSEYLKIPYSVLQTRILRGWTTERAFTEKVKTREECIKTLNSRWK